MTCCLTAKTTLSNFLNICLYLICPALPRPSAPQLIDDALDLSRAGQLSYSTALSLVSYLERERDFLPWDAAFDNLQFLEMQLRRTPGYGLFKVGHSGWFSTKM